ncbi:MAG TPA: GAF domain-containing protein, partial [Blastocatellia bacterium]
ALSGKMWVKGRNDEADGLEHSNLLACIPLKLGGRVTGAIAIFSLLSHKPELEEVDYEMFDLLATHAATALYCTELHASRVGAAD